MGPGSYNSKLTLTKQRPASCKFGKNKRFRKRKTDTNNVGWYQPEYKNIKKFYGSVKFGKEKLGITKNKNVPGPGSYKISKDFIHKNKNFSMRKREQKGNKSDVPGPGTYDLKFNNDSTKPNLAKYQFGKDKKLK